MGMTTQNSTVENWIIEHIRILWLAGSTYKRAAELATKDLDFKVHPARISRLRGEITMRLAHPFDGWTGRCKCMGYSWDTWLTFRQWDNMKAWIIKHQDAVRTIADVDIIARMARLNRISGVNPSTIRVALYDTRLITGYDPNLLQEAAGSGRDQGSKNADSPIATVGTQASEGAALCKV